MSSPATLSQSDLPTLKAIFPDEKLAKQVLNAAKRVSKKRKSTDEGVAVSPKRARKQTGEEPVTPKAIEESLALPSSTRDEQELARIIIITNRAPLVLAFAVTLLRYTMPEQPLSSRLSLAQAVVSANSRSKAVSLGLEKGRGAEEEGWGKGQPVVKVMGRDVRVLKRWGYAWNDDGNDVDQGTVKTEDSSVQQEDESVQTYEDATEPALWGLDLEALRSSNGPLVSGASSRASSNLPIFTAQSARAYLLKSFSSPPKSSAEEPNTSPRKKQATAVSEQREENLGLLLSALDLLFASWALALSKDELDRRAWSWYVHVRPEVQNGVAGWGGKGEVKLAEILGLRRKG
jgi:hypothetical protein